ncbi:glycerate kinase [Nocardioides sp. BYT-33-1]|uniref:glycerate kinase n=1 Tax=Nocardioides sp. BYT-33-1 TaxID=3416952 RepID=UPI003F529949
MLVAPDKFRGTATAADVAAEVAEVAVGLGWSAVALPLSDGGEGLLDVFGGADRSSTVTGPLGTPVTARWLLRGGRAVIEAAEACGLLLAGGAEGNDPVRATSAGVGDLIAEALRAGAAEIVIGLGGSACTDGGAGALDALGAWSPDWPGFGATRVTVCCDVDTRYVDAARVFGPQKGAGADEVAHLESRLQDTRARLRERWGLDPHELPGSGAAGGLGGALAVAGAELTRGIDHVADLVDLEQAIAAADLVITGEGRLDESSLQGKVVGGVIDRAEALGVPAVVIVGIADPSVRVGVPVHSLTATCGAAAALQRTRESLRVVAADVLARAQPTA